MTGRLLAGDIGGTKTNLALYGPEGSDGLRLIREDSFPSAGYGGLEDVIAEFLSGDRDGIVAAVFGVAGPVIDGRVEATNLPWTVAPEKLAGVAGTSRIRLMNDLETTAYGILFLDPAELHCLHPGEARRGNRAVIAAGTGLGQAILFWDGRRFVPSATEGGHVDFAPRNEVEVGLFQFLRDRFPRVSYERVLSGPGLVNIFQYLEQAGRPVEPAVAERMKAGDPGAVIGEAGVDGSSAICAEALDIFISVYGAQAGNLGLSCMAVGGVYLGGGIVTKILPRLAGDRFLAAFRDKGRSSVLLERMPVHAVLNAKASLIGASRMALELAS